MTPAPSPAPRTGGEFLDALAAIGPRPALTWYGAEGRTELSGRVLGNWTIKAANHLADEIAPAAGDALLLDLPPHWKRLVLALAGWTLGLEVRAVDRGPAAAGTGATAAAGDAGPSPQAAAVDGMLVVATDRPGTALADAADELLVLDAVSLALRASMPLPALAHDWAQEVRGAGDVLAVAPVPWSGPVAVSPGTPTDAAEVLVASDGADVDGGDIDGADAAAMLGAWLRGARVLGPAIAIDDAARAAEGIGPA